MRGERRARALSNPTYDILADSLDVRSPGQRLREIRAVRKAFAQSTPDTTHVHTKERDWMSGDTIVARFDSMPLTKADSAKQPAMLALIALGNAKSYYQIAAKDSAAIGPSINYVRGGAVTVAFVAHQVKSVTVKDSVAGVYVEPEVIKKKKKADSTATGPVLPKKKSKADSAAAKAPAKSATP